MFGRVKHHFKKAMGVGNTIAHRVTSAWGAGQKVAAGLSDAYRFAKQAYGAASPFLGQLIGQRGQALADRGAQQAFALGDRAQQVAFQGHEHVMDKVRAGGHILDQIRKVHPPTGAYAY